MEILLNAHKVSKSYGVRPLFNKISFSVLAGEKIGLIGPNGAGKTTLLRIISGLDSADEGTISYKKGIRIAFLEQIPTFREDATIESTILEGIADKGNATELAWVKKIFSKLSLSNKDTYDLSTPVSVLSGGWKKRVAIAREIAKRADLFLLDEPTNHIDIESIIWFETFLVNLNCATITITHDRLFLERVSNKIMELDKRLQGGVMKTDGNYSKYLEIKESMMLGQEQAEIRLKNCLRRETEWLRQGAKARSTKQQARIQRAGTLKNEVLELEERNKKQISRIEFQNANSNPKRLLVAEGISKAYGEKLVITNFDLIITPKTRIGIVGANGQGKSTLLKILAGAEAPDKGSIFRSEHLKINYFEQNRESLDANKTAKEVLCPVGEFIEFRGVKTHIRGYCERFLFSGNQIDLPVHRLSGGEQSRLLIAKLMLKESNLLILDEPTNDLDIATLNVLEDVLRDFNAGVIIVTHDRYFLSRVSTEILAFNKNCEIHNFASFNQWETWRELRAEKEKLPSSPRVDKKIKPISAKKNKLSFKELYEYNGMEEKIALTEKKLKELTNESERDQNMKDHAKMRKLTNEMNELQGKIDSLYERWAELEAIHNS